MSVGAIGSAATTAAAATTTAERFTLEVGRAAEFVETQRVARTGARLVDELTTLRSALALHSRQRARSEPAIAVSATTLPLASTSFVAAQPGSAATLSATEAFNTDSTQFAPSAPSFGGLSSASPTVSGYYGGQQGAGTLSFRVSQAGVVGISTARVEVLDPALSVVEEVEVNGADPAGTTYALSNGLSLQFGNGSLLLGDSFTVDVQTGLDFAVDADAPFDGSGAPPQLQHDRSITAGAFDVNGVSIAVTADDTLTAVLGRITASAAGVDAAYDEVSEIVTLTQRTVGAAPDIVLANDTSGFFAAAKLTGAVLQPGTDTTPEVPAAAPLTDVMSSVSLFAAVQAGAIEVNGFAIAVDPAVDSLADVLARIETSAGVTAEVKANRVIVRGTQLNDLVLDDNATGFFAALAIDSETYEATSRRGVNRLRVAAEAAHGVARVVDRLNELFTVPAGHPRLAIHDDLAEDIAPLVNDRLVVPLAGLGINSALTGTGSVSGLQSFDARSFERASTSSADRVLGVFLGDQRDPTGFLTRLIETLRAALLANPVGQLIDLIV